MSRRKKFDFDLIVKHKRYLRKNSTEFENLLWNELRGRKLSGYKFSRQHPILYGGNLIRYNFFVADFYCAAKKQLLNLMALSIRILKNMTILGIQNLSTLVIPF